jgi:hypothetical protein
MKKIFLLFLIASAINIISYPQDIQKKYSAYGDIIKLQLNNGSFPHPKRAKGYQYKDQFYPADVHYSDSSAAFFIPANFQQTDSADLVIHFHGWGNCIDSTFLKFSLVEQFCKSNKNAILVIPEGPKFAPDSFGGKLEDKDGFKKFIEESIDKLYALGKIKTKNVRNIIISGHSGGYHVMAYILLHGGITEKIKEAFLYDALYGDIEKFSYWIDHSKGKCINIYTTDGGTKGESENLMECLTSWNIPYLAKRENDILQSDLTNNRLIFIYSDFSHSQVIYYKNEFYKFLAASCLDDIK